MPPFYRIVHVLVSSVSYNRNQSILLKVSEGVRKGEGKEEGSQGQWEVERQRHAQCEDLGENFLVHDDQDEQDEDGNDGSSYDTLFVHPSNHLLERS